MKTNQLLERVTVGFRCPMNWEKMVGNEQERFCNQCQKSVTDLSQMTTGEVEAFLEKQGPKGQACVRILRNEKGDLITKGCGSAAAQSQRLVKKAVAVGMATSGLAAAACSSESRPIEVAEKGAPPCPSPVVTEECTEEVTGGAVMMGVICLPPETD